MKRGRALYHLMRADMLERVRRYSFLFVLGLAGYLGYAANTGALSVRLDQYRGVYNSAWVGATMTLVTTTFLTLVGFYLVKNTIERDLETGVGEVIATTPVTRFDYVAGKALSNFAVLTVMVAILLGAAVVMQLASREGGPVQIGGLVLPFVLVAFPAMAVVAALAVLFETLPALRGGFGNVAYFFCWMTALALSAIGEKPYLDLSGFVVIGDSMRRAVAAAFPDYQGGFSVSFSSHPEPLQTFQWDGVTWTPALVWSRGLWLGIALALVSAAALLFHRFDPAREPWRLRPVAPPEPDGATMARAVSVASRAVPSGAALAPSLRRFSYARLVAAELRLMLKGWPWWWYLGALALVVAGAIPPLPQARGVVLPLAWIWPVLLWSGLGTRELRHGTTQLVFSVPHLLRRQLPAAWIAGVLAGLIITLAIGTRLALAGEWTGVAAWLTGACFIPAAALALGVWSRSAKLFEVLYTIAWYLGPLHHTRPLDFMGTTSASEAAGPYLLATLLVGALAVIGRAKQLRANG